MSFLHTADSVERWVITPMESLLTEWTRHHLDKFVNFWFRYSPCRYPAVRMAGGRLTSIAGRGWPL